MSRRGLFGLVSGLAVGGVLLGDRSSGAAVRLTAVQENAEVGTEKLPGQPDILSCDQWGAREPSDAVTVLHKRPVKILVHHTATANRKEVGEADLKVLARAIQDHHMKTNGWIDSGHHFLINRGGLIAEGRHGSLKTLLGGQAFVEGVHCPDQNDSSIGIENQGSYGDIDPPNKLLISLRALCAFACRQYDIDPTHVYGHRDFRDTACPGDQLYALLPWLRDQVGRMLGKGTEWRAIAEPTWPLLRMVDSGPRVLAAQYLLRAAGMAGLPPDGVFGEATKAAVLDFQRQRGLELTGMIGGASWPLLAVEVRPGQGGDAELAVRALLTEPGAAETEFPPVVDRRTWQRLLGTG